MYDTYMYILLKQSLFHSNINYIIDKNSNIPAIYNIKTVFSMHHIEVTYILFLTYIFIQLEHKEVDPRHFIFFFSFPYH